MIVVPEQTVSLPDKIVIGDFVGGVFTVTATVAVPGQAPFVPVTVYVVFPKGEA